MSAAPLHSITNTSQASTAVTLQPAVWSEQIHSIQLLIARLFLQPNSQISSHKNGLGICCSREMHPCELCSTRKKILPGSPTPVMTMICPQL